MWDFKMLAGAHAIDRPDGFAAGGSLARSQTIAKPDRTRRAQLIAELIAMFVALPFVMRFAVITYKVPLFYALPPVLALMAAFLYFDPTFRLSRELRRGFTRDTLRSIVMIFIAGAAVVSVAVAAVFPHHLFGLVWTKPALWIKIMILYPVTSVLTQEFVYRSFFFHRYGPLFKSRWALIITSGVLFGLGHVIFSNWIAVAGTTVAGMLFAWRYERTRSFWAVWFEHVLWGWLVFTIGLGVFFFTGFQKPVW